MQKIILFFFSILFFQFYDAQEITKTVKDTIIIHSDSLTEDIKVSEKIEIKPFKVIKTQTVQIDDNISLVYERPRLFDMVTKLPRDFGSMGKLFVQPKNLMWFGASAAATAAILPFDQQLLDGSVDFGDRIGWPNDNSYDKLGPLNIIPKNIPSAIYYIGNGGTVVLGSLSLFTYALFTNNYRAYSTSSQLIEGIFATGLVTQLIKRTTGRQSPDMAIESGNSGGAWQPFPSFADYQNNTPNYDAMPSGHIALYMTSLMIMAENYPEHKWIKPVGFGFMGLLMFEMMATRVHWVSDYPLAIFFGYIIGKSIAKNRFKKIDKRTSHHKFKPVINYSFSMGQNYLGDDYTVGGIIISF